MKKSLIAILASGALALSMNAFASKPTSITFEAEGTTADGQEYANYVVRCSNGERQPHGAKRRIRRAKIVAHKKGCRRQEAGLSCKRKKSPSAAGKARAAGKKTVL